MIEAKNVDTRDRGTNSSFYGSVAVDLVFKVPQSRAHILVRVWVVRIRRARDAYGRMTKQRNCGGRNSAMIFKVNKKNADHYTNN